MPENKFLTPDIIARESLMILQSNTVMAGLVYRDYEEEFGPSKVGDTITIRKPATFEAKEFSGHTEVQDAKEGRVAEFGASIQEQTGSWPEDIPEPPDIPPALEHLWAWFWQLRTANPSAGFGPAPLSFGEMDAWQRVTGNRLEPWHVDTLLAMDAAFPGL